MKKILVGIIVSGLLIAIPALAKEGVTPMLKMQTTYNFVLGSSFIPVAPFVEHSVDDLWALAWEGTIEGDVEGVIRWWVTFTPPATFGSLGRWEIWNCEPVYPSPGCDFNNPDLLLMAGHDVFGYLTGTVWAGRGIVTYASGDYAEWLGRKITDGGWVEYDLSTGFPAYGEGPFVIYNTPSHKH